MGRQQEWVYHVEPEEFPQDFPERLDRFREAAGLTWRELARRLKINARSVRRWKAGTRPGPGHLVSLFNLAAAKGVLTSCSRPRVSRRRPSRRRSPARSGGDGCRRQATEPTRGNEEGRANGNGL